MNIKKAVKEIITIVIKLLFIIAVFETVLQIGGKLHDYNKNKLETSIVHDKGAYTILCIGGSLTEGQYPWHLEEILNSKNMGIKFTVVDQGISATNADFIVGKVSSYIDKFKPNMVIAMLSNDTNDPVVYESSPGPFYTSIKTYRLIQLIRIRLAVRLVKLKTKTEEAFNNFKNHKKYSSPDDINNNKIHKDKTENNSYLETGKFYEKQKKYKDAERSYLKAIKLYPKSYTGYLTLGNLYTELKRYQEAEEMYKKASRLNPENPWPYIALGDLYKQQKEYKKAEQLLHKALKLDPRNFLVHKSLSSLYLNQKKYNEAEQALYQALDLYPAHEWIYLELGNTYLEQGKYREAEDSYYKGIRINPENEFIYKFLENLYREQKRYKEAAEIGGKRLELSINKNKNMISELYEEDTKQLKVRRLDNSGESSVCNYSDLSLQYAYTKLRNTLKDLSIKLVCVQFPTLKASQLEDMLGSSEGIVFVDNEKSFNDGVKREGYDAYFIDHCGESFGHCTYKGNRLLAENIAKSILHEYSKSTTVKVSGGKNGFNKIHAKH